jgi:hypothetical protein
MATPTAPTVDTPSREAAPEAAKGPLASILTPVEPARPVERIGTTATMAEEPVPAGVENSKPAKSSGRSSQAQDSHWAALVRAVASRIGRTGTTRNFKHTISESRANGNQVNTANRITRDAKQHHIAQNRDTRDAKVADLNNKIRQHQGRDSRDAKSSDNRAATSASRNGRDVKDHRDAKASDATAAKKDAATKDSTSKADQTARDAKTASSTAQKDATAGKAGQDTKTSDSAVKKDTATKTTAPKTGRGDTTPTNTTTPAGQDRPRTQPSREAGYHDGTRAAKVAGHVKAYRDGAKDGYADGTAEYEQEKRRMDDAKARNATKPAGPVKPEMAPASGSTVDLAKKDTLAQPTDTVPVVLTGISDRTVSFDADGASHTLSRVEVRTLKGFERRIAAKAPVLQKVAEGSKVARTRAAEHATRAQQLAELAKDVKGGDRLVAKLLRLAEQAKALQARTEEVEKHAQRGAEAVNVLVANANTRHGGIYRAVADSPLTSPAEREFYQDKEGN